MTSSPTSATSHKVIFTYTLRKTSHKVLYFVSESLIAIPETINASSIAVVGEWDRFNVTWAAARRVNVNNSRVFYDVSLAFSEQNKIEVRIAVIYVNRWTNLTCFKPLRLLCWFFIFNCRLSLSFFSRVTEIVLNSTFYPCLKMQLEAKCL